MPQEVYLEDGTATEVPTQAEVDAQIEQKVGETKLQYEERIKDLEKEINPNWKEARGVIASLKKAVEAKGGKVDDTGALIDEKPINMQMVEERAREAARRELLGSEIENRLNSYNEDSRETIKGYFDKLSAGENLNIGSIHKIMDDAEQLVLGTSRPSPRGSTLIRGSAPSRGDSNQESYDKKPEGKNLMSAMGLPSANEKEKK